MSLLLQGPFPLDLLSVAASARAALGQAAQPAPGALLPLEEAPATPGLYLLWAGGDRPRLLGFWLLFGRSYLELGPPGPPDREPPFCRALLSAATEAVWWQTLPVHAAGPDRWQPLIVFEWPPEQADRCALPPPGVPPEAEVSRVETQDDGAWIVPVATEPSAAPRAAAQRSGLPDLPSRRSVVMLAAGAMVHNNRTHTAEFGALPLAQGEEPIEAEAWVESALSQTYIQNETSNSHSLGPALRLPGGRVGFQLQGWLTRDLALWPPRPDELRPGALQARDVGRRWRTQVLQVVASTALVMAVVLYLAAAVQLAAQPRIRAVAALPPRAAQPAMSVCSADTRRFVEELRCQIAAFAEGGDASEPACDDVGGDGRGAPDTDLQAAWCGLRDREQDGWVSASGDHFADLAAARACFNVLGHPYTYEAAAGVVDPDKLLYDRDLGLRALSQLVGELDAACDRYRGRVTATVEGAILATVAGAPDDEEAPTVALSEPARLRRMLMDRATTGRSREEERCLRAGARHGVESAQLYDQLCEGPDEVDGALAKRKAWKVLGGAPGADASVIARYTDARFGGPAARRAADAPPWTCHLELSRPRPGDPVDVPVRWDLTVPRPARYNPTQGLVRSQLPLDAALRTLADGGDAGPCWAVAARSLNRYTPAHPLLAVEASAAWPSAEQQVCGQICATWYRVRQAQSGGEWATPGADLALCLDDSPSASRPDLGRGRLDRLRLPWSQEQRGAWVEPDAAEICAFNLVAQGYLPDVTPEGLAPPLWAGSTTAGSGLAGGTDGVAATSAKNLSSYGRSRSNATCSAVATECFVSGMLEVTSTRAAEPYQWMDQWRRWWTALPETRDPRPWCRLIQPYVRRDGTLPEGQLDYPCAEGVDSTRRAVEATLTALANGSFGEVRR